MAFRPTIARGLALSAMSSFFRLLPLNTAISMPKERGFFNRLISKNSLNLEIILEGRATTFFDTKEDCLQIRL